MLTVPLAAALAFVLAVMLRKGGWKLSQVLTGVAFGIAVMSTALGPDLAGLLNDFTGWLTGAVADAFGGKS